MVTELLQKYIWLVNTFVRAGMRGLSLDEICTKWESRFGSSYSRRTFNNHRQNVLDVFGITIGCNRSTNRYFIDSSDDVSDESAETAWLINTFTVNNMLSLGKERLSGRVAVENIPSGHLHLTSVFEAMTENRELIIEYRKYSSTSAEKLTIRPYAVKENAKRWYIIAFCVERQGLRVYGLDRVTSLEITDTIFTMPKEFDIAEMFATSFGIYLPDGHGQKITFRTSHQEASYLRDLPIHESQTEETSDEKGVTFSIFVCPASSNGEIYKDIIMELCKYGSRLEVLSPEYVRNEVRDELARTLALYSE